MNFNSFITEQQESVTLTPIIKPDYDFIALHGVEETIKRNPELWIYSVTTFREADPIYGTFKRMDRLNAKIALEDKNIKWEKHVVCNHAAATLFMRETDYVLPGYIKDNIEDYDFHYIVEGDAEVIEKMHEINYWNGHKRVNGEEPFMRMCLLGKYNVMSKSTFDTFKGLMEKKKLKSFNTFLESKEDDEYLFNFKFLDTFNDKDYPDHMGKEDRNRFHYFLVEYRYVDSEGNYRYRKGTINVSDREYTMYGVGNEKLISPGFHGLLKLYDEYYSKDENYYKNWKGHVKGITHKHGLFDAVSTIRKPKDYNKGYYDPDNRERVFKRKPEGNYEYASIHSTGNNLPGKILPENFRDLVNYLFIDHTEKLGTIALSTHTSKEVVDTFGGLYESVDVDGLEVLAFDPAIDGVEISDQLVFRYNGVRYLYSAMNRGQRDEYNYNVDNTLFVYSEDIDKDIRKKYAGVILPFKSDKITKCFDDEFPKKFFGIVNFYKTKDANTREKKFEINEIVKFEEIKKKYYSQDLVDKLFSLVTNHLINKKTRNSLEARVNLSDVASSKVVDAFGGLYESNK